MGEAIGLNLFKRFAAPLEFAKLIHK